MDATLKNEYSKILEEFASEQAKILEPFQGSKEAYFLYKGVTYTGDPNEKLNLGMHFIDSDDDEAVFILFDPFADSQDLDWLQLMLTMSNDENGSFHDLSRVDRIAVCMAYLEHVEAFEFAASIYLFGKRQVSESRELGVYWLKRAIEYGQDIPPLLKSYMPENYLGEEMGWTSELLNDYETDRASLISSTLSAGPIYNRFNELGIPILGDFLSSGENPFTNPIHAQVNPDAYVPAPGIVSLSGLLGNPDGTINFHTICKLLNYAI